MTPQEFITTYKNDIIRACLGTPIFPSVKMAQMALETGWGAHKVGNNMFGIKATGSHTPYWKGAKIESNTAEYIAGQAGTYKEPFRLYNSIEDSIIDHNHLLIQNTRYATVLAASTPEIQAMALQSAGYATDPNYAQKLKSIINQHNLKELDQTKKFSAGR